MSIRSSAELLAESALVNGWVIREHLLIGSNREIAPDSYVPDDDGSGIDSVTFAGTAGRDTLIGGGGEVYTFFLGSAGNDLYGTDTFSNSYADYSAARGRVVVDLTLDGGSRTFTDESGDRRTVHVLGMALRDGFGGTDSFIETPDVGIGLLGVFGSRFGDLLVGPSFCDLYGGAGNDWMIGGGLHGGEGRDILIARSAGDSSSSLWGDEGDDFLWDSNDGGSLHGGAGNDRIFARGGNDYTVVGEAGNDYIDGGSGNDFIDGGIGRDILVSGSGNDIINPDGEMFRAKPGQVRDGDRDVIRVNSHDLGDFNDVVLSRSFEEGRDEIRFRDAVRDGADYRIYHEAQSVNDAGNLLRPDDLADRQNTVLEIDQDGNGFDSGDYFLFVLDAMLTEHNGFMLT